MTTQYTTILKLALPVEGELSGTWGDVVNDNITQMVEQAVAGKAVVNTWTGNSHTLTTADGTTSESRCAILELTDSGTALTGAGTVVCPTNTKLYIVDNNTARVITVKTSGGTGVAVPVGKTMLVYCDGTNVVEGVTHANSLSLGTSTSTVNAIATATDLGAGGSSNSNLPTQLAVKTYVDGQIAATNELSEVLTAGNTTGSTDIEVTAAQKVQFRDAAIYINSSVDGQLDIVADGEVQIATALVDINGNLDVSGTTNISGSTSFTKNAIAGVAINTAARSSNTVTITNSAVHGLTNGDLVNINGVANRSFNGYFTVSVSSTTVFTYSQTGANESSSGGTSTEIVYNLNASGTALNQMNGPLNITANSGIDGLEITQSGSGEALSITGGLVVDGAFSFGTSVDGVINSPAALYLNFDSDNNSAGEAFVIGSNRASGSGGNEHFRVDASGSVGIGTSTPASYDFNDAAKLVVSNTAGNSTITIASGTTSNGYLAFADGTSGTDRYAGAIQYSHNTNHMQFNTNGGVERMRIDSSGNVGIGTSSPARPLHVSTSGVIPLRLASTGTDCQIELGNSGGTPVIGSFNDQLIFNTASSERMRIDSSGNVLVGTTDSTPYDNSANSTADNGIVAGSGLFAAARYQGSVGLFNRTGNDGEILGFKRSGAAVGGIGSDTSGNLQTVSATGNYRFGDSNTTRWSVDATRMYPMLDNTYDLGLPAIRVRNLYLSNNLSLSNASTAAFLQVSSDVLQFGTSSNDPVVFYANNAERMRISADGEVTKLYQPAFSVTVNAAQNDIAINTDVPIVFGAETFDVGSNFTGNEFTAPVTGKYQLNLLLRLDSIDTAADYYIISFFTSNRQYRFIYTPSRFTADPAYWSTSLGILADMDASDTVYVTVNQSGGSAQTDVVNATSYQRFTGYLVA